MDPDPSYFEKRLNDFVKNLEAHIKLFMNNQPELLDTFADAVFSKIQAIAPHKYLLAG